jgi:hypothetical protein
VPVSIPEFAKLAFGGFLLRRAPDLREPNELLTTSCNDAGRVGSEHAPLLTKCAGKLLEVSFEAIAVHGRSVPDCHKALCTPTHIA